MKKILGGSLILLSSGLYAASITAIEHSNTDRGYQLIFKNVGVQPTSFNTDSSIVLDFPNTTSSLKSKGIDIASNGIYNVDVIQGQGRTRAVINLSSAKVYDVRRQGDDVVVTVAGSKGALSNAAGTPIAQISRPNNKMTKQKSQAAFSGLAPIFRRTDNGRAAFTIRLPSPKTLVDVRSEGNRIILNIPGVHLPRKDQKRLDVSDYGTPVNFADIRKTSSGAQIVLNTGKNRYEFVSYQAKDTYTVEVFQPAENESNERKVQEMLGFGDGKQYKGEPISLNFQDIEVRAVLQIIAEFTHTNIVVSDGVVGNITLRLDNVPWDQALDIILKTKGLDKRKSGDVIYVATIDELRNSELTILQILKEKAQLTPTRIERIQVQYASAEDLKNSILEMRVMSNNDNKQAVDSVLSDRGSLTAEPRTNTIIVNDIPEKTEAVRKLVEALDKPVRQVLVDSRVVLTEDNFGRDFGARFGTSFINRSNNTLMTGTGSSNGAYTIAESVVNGGNPVKVPDLSNRLGVNMPVSGASGTPASYGLAILSGDFLVDLELSALQTEGRVEIVSSPRVVTQDGTKAEVWSGVQVPIVTKGDDGKSSLQNVSASLSLAVTPRIAPNHMVNMELDINNDELGRNVSVAGQSQFSKTISGLKTSVLVDNGETIVLGGVYKQTQRASTDKVPLLGDIPVIGNAFKNNSRTFNKSELLIFVTPRIIDKKLIDQDKFSNLRD